MGELGTLIGGLAISRMQELSAMVDYPAEWRRLAQEFCDIPDPQENLRAFKKDGRWQLTGGISAEYDPARIRYRYRSLAERAAALAETQTGSLEEWLELLATKGPPHETRRGGGKRAQDGWSLASSAHPGHRAAKYRFVCLLQT